MKHINRFQIGIELFLSQISTITSPANDVSPEETIELLKEQSFSAQTEFCKKIQSGLRRLISDRYDVSSFIPARVKAVAESQFTPTPERLLPIFKWVASLHRTNQQMRVQWLSDLKNVSDRIGADAGHFLESFSMMTSQRISLVRVEDRMVLSVPDRLWGQAKLIFEDAACNMPDALPCFGYIFWVEADTTENGYVFRLLIDSEFSETVYTERLLQNKNWVEFSIECSSAVLAANLCDYTLRVRNSGRGAFETSMICCRELLHKASILGVYALNPAERELLGVAQILLHTGVLQQLDTKNLLPPLPADDLFENRYSFERAAAYFQQSCGIQGDRLHQLLMQILDAYEEGLQKKFAKYLAQFSDYWEQLVKTGRIRVISHPLQRSFAKATAGFREGYSFERYLSDARAALSRTFSPLLEEHGFSGSFPHFRRIRRHKAEFLSFVLRDPPAARSDGNIYFTYGIQLSRCSYSYVEGDTLVFDMPYENCTAAECGLEKSHYSDFARLDRDESGTLCVFCYEYNKLVPEERSDAMAKSLIPCFHLALDCFDNKPVPKKYAAQHKRILHASHRFGRLLGEFSAVGILVSILLLYFGKSRVVTTTHAVILTVSSILAGAAVVLLCSILGYGRMKRRIWNREK